jgi:tetratricopeptide (TPR) repeat protein
MAVVAVIALGGLTVWQTGYWMDSRGLFARCLEVTTRNHVAHFLYGRELLQAGDEAAAFSHFDACRQLDSNSIYGAQAWIVFGRRHAAREELERAEECDLLVDTNRLGEGIEVLERAVRTDPESFVARHSLGYAYLRRGDVERATAELERAVELDPQFAPSLRLLERIRQSRGE